MKQVMLLVMTVCVVGTLCLACAAKPEAPEAPAEPAAPAAPAPAEALMTTVKASATVTAINHETREVTLTLEDGEEFSLIADEAVENLDQVSQGDVVIATYTEALAYEVIRGGEEAGLETTAAAAAAELGEMPGAIAGRSTTLMVTVTSIDTEAPSVTFMGPGGNTRTIQVLYPEKLDGVSVGDSVEITYAEALAISVEKAD